MLSLSVLSATCVVENNIIDLTKTTTQDLPSEVLDVLESVRILLVEERTTILQGEEVCVGLFAFRRGKAKFVEHKYEEGEFQQYFTVGDEKQHGKSVFQKDGIPLQEVEYANGELHGKLKTFCYTDGSLEKEVSYVRGKKHGLFTSWWNEAYNPGVPLMKYKESTYENGKRHGLYVLWASDGRKILEEQYKNGKLDGTRKTWYTSIFGGGQSSEEIYVDGKRVGTCTYWGRDGISHETI